MNCDGGSSRPRRDGRVCLQLTRRVGARADLAECFGGASSRLGGGIYDCLGDKLSKGVDTFSMQRYRHNVKTGISFGGGQMMVSELHWEGPSPRWPPWIRLWFMGANRPTRWPLPKNSENLGLVNFHGVEEKYMFFNTETLVLNPFLRRIHQTSMSFWGSEENFGTLNIKNA